MSAIIYIGGAIGIEMIGGYYMSKHQALDFNYMLITSIEETLEIIGIIVLIDTLLKYTKENVRLKLKLV